MSHPECKCLKPDGGGTKCPPQHIALCIRGKDKECYGECIEIPNNFKLETDEFNIWMEDSIRQKIRNYISTVLTQENTYDSLRVEKIIVNNIKNGGTFKFKSQIGIIHVRFNFQFNNDDNEPENFQDFKILTL